MGQMYKIYCAAATYFFSGFLIILTVYKNCYTSLKSCGIQCKRKTRDCEGGRKGVAEVWDHVHKHTYVPLTSVGYLLNLLAFKVNQIVMWFAGAPLCPGMYSLLSNNTTATNNQHHFGRRSKRRYVQLRREDVSFISYVVHYEIKSTGFKQRLDNFLLHKFSIVATEEQTFV